MYNAMIRACATKTNDMDGPTSYQTLNLYKQLLYNGMTPNCLTLPFLLKDCTRRLDSGTGQAVHGHSVKYGFDEDVFVNNSLISFYSACRILNNALRVFDEMGVRDTVTWNSMVIGCLRNGDLDSAVDLFRGMKRRNIISWNSIITGFVQGGRPKQAIEFFHEMQILGDDLVRPDKMTVASVLSACASVGAIDQGKWVHSFLKRSGLECDVAIGTALVDMYGKCGCMERAVEVFKEMPRKDILAWTAMISAFALHGCGKEAFVLFKEMEELGVRPNSVTFGALLSACAHSGLVEKGHWCFDVMKRVYSIEPQVQHYACMVDVLSRAGLFDEAKGLIRVMPMEPDVYVWGALLGGCQMHGDLELGEEVAKYLIRLEPLNHAFYVTLGEIYAKAGRFHDAKRIRALMHGKGIKKAIPGCSMIEVDGIVHEFSVRGSPTVLIEEIMCIIHCLTDGMKIEWNMQHMLDLFE